jgi:hypothetical protein
VIENAAHSRALTRWTRETLGAGHVGEMVGRLKGEPRAALFPHVAVLSFGAGVLVRLSLEQSPRILIPNRIRLMHYWQGHSELSLRLMVLRVCKICFVSLENIFRCRVGGNGFPTDAITVALSWYVGHDTIAVILC